HTSGVPLYIHSFPTRRSSDLALVRIPFRWERVQRNPGQALDATELQRLQDAVTRARNAGLKVIIDMHNYGAYYLCDSSQNKGVRDRKSTRLNSSHVKISYAVF